MATAATSKAPKPKVVWQYSHDGKPISKHQNKVSSIAYWYTWGIAERAEDFEGQDCLSAADFRELMLTLGVKDLKSKFKVQLPNEVWIESRPAVLGDPAWPDESEAKPARAARSATAQKPKRLTAAERAELAEKGKKENERLKRWKDKGSVGNRPATPALDELKANPNPRTEKRAAQTSQAFKRASGSPNKATAAKRTAAPSSTARKSTPKTSAGRSRKAA